MQKFIHDGYLRRHQTYGNILMILLSLATVTHGDAIYLLKIITRLIAIKHCTLNELTSNCPLFCNCPLLKDINFSKKCLLVSCD